MLPFQFTSEYYDRVEAMEQIIAGYGSVDIVANFMTGYQTRYSQIEIDTINNSRCYVLSWFGWPDPCMNAFGWLSP